MYVFFDKNGVIREIVNDKPVRIGSQNANKIYFYFDHVTPYDVFVTIQWSNGDKTPETSILLNQETKEIPYNKNRDLKYFKDYKPYNFYYYEIENVASNGLAEATVRVMENENSLFSQGLLTFNIENGIIKDDYFINQSQFDYLIKQMGKVDQNSLLALNKALEVQQIALDKPMVYFESDFKNLVIVLSVSEQAKVGDIFVLLAENQPDFVVISEETAQRVNYITISQYEIENDLVPFAEVGKIYKIENSNKFIIAIESGIQKPTVDKDLNLNSENPVQNKVVTAKFNEIEQKLTNVSAKSNVLLYTIDNELDLSNFINTILTDNYEHLNSGDILVVRYYYGEFYKDYIYILRQESPMMRKTWHLLTVYDTGATSGGNITVEQQVNDSTNPVSSVAVKNEFGRVGDYYDEKIERAVVIQKTFGDGEHIIVENNKDYHADDYISTLTIVIPDENILCSLMFTTVDSGLVEITIDGAKGYIGKAPDLEENGVTWELSIHNGIIASGKVVSE